MTQMRRIQRAASANQVLSVLSAGDFELLRPDLEEVSLSLGDVLHRPWELVGHVYFPAGAVVALLLPVAGYAPTEVGMVGRDGIVGASLALGVEASPTQDQVLAPGLALRMTAANFRLDLERIQAFRLQVEYCLYSVMAQLAQTAACNRFHPIGGRLARLLLMVRDQSRTEHFQLTQGLLAQMLGVRRAGVTIAARTLQRKKLIDYSRGELRILDGLGLERAACSCYRRLPDLPRPDDGG